MKLNTVKPSGYKRGLDLGFIGDLIPLVDIAWSQVWKVFLILNILGLAWCGIYNLHVFVSHNLYNRDINIKTMREELIPVKARLEQVELKIDELDARSVTTYQYITKYKYRTVDPKSVR